MKRLLLPVVSAFLLLLFGCESNPPTPQKSGFLKDYAKLQPMPDRPQALYYEKPNIDWSKYTQILIEPVRIQRTTSDDGSSMSRRDRLMLGIYFEYTMRDAVQRKYRIVQQPGPGVLRVRAAINDVKSADSLLNELSAPAGGAYGEVSMEGELVDAMTGERLVAMVDTKAGSMFASYSSWDDVTQAFDDWGTQLFQILSKYLGDVSDEDIAKSIAQANTMNNQQPVTSKLATKTASATSGEEDINTLLTNAAQDVQANRLTTPAGRNALDRYRKVLQLSPGNAQATAGLETIVEKYVGWGEHALQSNNRSKARLYLNKAKNILADSEAVIRLQNAIENAPIEKQVVTAPISKPKPTPQATPVSKPKPAPVSKPKPTPIAQPKPKPAPVAKPQPAAPKPAPVVVKKPEPKAFDPWNGKPGTGSANANASNLQPFLLGLKTSGGLQDIANAAKKRLKSNGFTVVGEYSPYNSTRILVVTNSTLKSIAARSEFGGYGAAIRVSITHASGGVQISYTNPIYTSNIYRMNGNLSGVANKLKQALGSTKTFGTKSGLSAKKLRKWHYMFGMPYFDDPITLASSGSYQQAVKKIESALAAGKGGAKKVYRIDIPGKDETIFGVALTQGKGSDATVMKAIDNGTLRHSAHLPYEILVSGKKAYILNGKFRIALSFPDLTMGQFMSIKDAPDAIENALKAVAK